MLQGGYNFFHAKKKELCRKLKGKYSRSFQLKKKLFILKIDNYET